MNEEINWAEVIDALPWPSMEPDGESGLEGAIKGRFLKNMQFSMNRCLAPGDDCRNQTILAHTVQNARTLQLLQRNGHVKTFRPGLDEKGRLALDIEDIGRNKATTFEGFCSNHDTQLFVPIDTLPLDEPSAEQLFLLAYRAVAREVHAQMSGAMRLQQAFREGVEAGRFSKDQPSVAGLLPVRHMLIAYEGYKYKFDLDQALISRNYSSLHHKVLYLRDTLPSIAASSCFTVPEWTRDLARVSLNLLPLSTDTSIAIFSYTPAHEEAAKSMLGRVFEAEGHLQKYLLSKLVLARCENMVIAPDSFDTWTTDQIDVMKRYFSETTSDYFDREDSRLYLFRN